MQKKIKREIKEEIKDLSISNKAEKMNKETDKNNENNQTPVNQLNIGQNLIEKRNKYNTFEDLSYTAMSISNDVCNALALEVEDLNVRSSVFRQGMERSFIRVLNALYKKQEQFVIFPEAIPGYTLLTFKKQNRDVYFVELKREPSAELKEFTIVNSVLNNFFKKNQQILLIENKDIIFAMFPVSDIKKNLKDLDLYITY